MGNPYPKLPPKEKKKRLPLKRSPIKKKFRVTGEKAVFLFVWNTRKHECENCGAEINEFNVSNFHHVKRKGKYPELRLEESNIKIVCQQCHYNIHFGFKK